MLKNICAWLLYRRMGWKTNITVAHPKKYIICLAPHTSNMDFLIGLLFSRAENMSSGFLMKKEWFFWPLGPIWRKLGGIPVWRDKKGRLFQHLHHARRNAFAKPRLEERLLLHRTKGRHTYLAIWC